MPYGIFRRLDGISDGITDDASYLSIDQPLKARGQLRSTNENGNRNRFESFTGE